MQQRNFPPTRKSISQKGAVKPFGPHHCITYFGFVHASQTNARGASKTLVITIRSVSLTVFFVISDLRFFHLIHNHIQLVETLFPESAIPNRPFADCLYLTCTNLCFPCAAYRSRVHGLTEVQVRKGLIFLAAGEGKSPTHNPWCLVRLTGILAVPAFL